MALELAQDRIQLAVLNLESYCQISVSFPRVRVRRIYSEASGE
jgi:hypothetical protein